MPRGYYHDGYYDPQLEQLIPLATTGLSVARKGISKGFHVARTFAKTQTINLAIKLALVAGLWGLGIYVLWQFQKSGLKQIAEKFTLPSFIIPLSPVIGIYTMLFNVGSYLDELFKKNEPSEEAKPEIQKFVEDMKTYIIVWSIICILIGLYVVYQHRQERMVLVQ